MNDTPILHLICGRSAASKAALARRIEREERALRLSPDEWSARMGIDPADTEAVARVDALQWDLAQTLLRCGFHVVIEDGFPSRREREEMRAAAAAAGSLLRLHILDGLDAA